jgi:hypothetical protein
MGTEASKRLVKWLHDVIDFGMAVVLGGATLPRCNNQFLIMFDFNR